MATIKEVAKLSGVSITTVSRVLNNDPTLSVSDKTREKVFDAADQLNYKKKIFRPMTKNIGLLYWITDMEELEDVYFKSLRMELEKIAESLNIELITYKISEGIEKVPDDLAGFVAVGIFSEKELEYLKKITTNGVFIDSSPAPYHYDSVRADVEMAIHQTIDFFISKGHQEIGFIGGTYKNPNTGEEEMDIREKAFKEYMKEKDLLNEALVFCNQGFSVENGYDLMKKALSQLEERMPTAFVTAADPIAVGCLQALNEAAVAIPDRVSVVGINNISVTKYVSPPLTTFDIDLKELGKNALELLLEQIWGKRQVVKKVYVGPVMVKRKSAK